MNTIERLVLRMIGENVSNPDVFTDDAEGMAPIRDSINDAVEEITMLTGGYQDTVLVPLVDESTFYRLTFKAGHLGWITDAWLVGDERRLEQVDMTRLRHIDPRWMDHTGSPEAYFPVGLDFIGIYPKQSGNSDVLQLKCAVIPGRYERDTERVMLRERFQWAAVHYAVSEYYAGRGDRETAETHLARYLQEVGLRDQYTKHPEQERMLQTEKEPWSGTSQRRPF